MRVGNFLGFTMLYTWDFHDSTTFPSSRNSSVVISRGQISSRSQDRGSKSKDYCKTSKCNRRPHHETITTWVDMYQTSNATKFLLPNPRQNSTGRKTHGSYRMLSSFNWERKNLGISTIIENPPTESGRENSRSATKPFSSNMRWPNMGKKIERSEYRYPKGFGCWVRRRLDCWVLHDRKADAEVRILGWKGGETILWQIKWKARIINDQISGLSHLKSNPFTWGGWNKLHDTFRVCDQDKNLDLDGGDHENISHQTHKPAPLHQSNTLTNKTVCPPFKFCKNCLDLYPTGNRWRAFTCDGNFPNKVDPGTTTRVADHQRHASQIPHPPAPSNPLSLYHKNPKRLAAKGKCSMCNKVPGSCAKLPTCSSPHVVIRRLGKAGYDRSAQRRHQAIFSCWRPSGVGCCEPRPWLHVRGFRWEKIGKMGSWERPWRRQPRGNAAEWLVGVGKDPSFPTVPGARSRLLYACRIDRREMGFGKESDVQQTEFES